MYLLAIKQCSGENFLSSKEVRQFDKEMQACKASGEDCTKVAEYIEISNKNSKEIQEAFTGGGITCITRKELIKGSSKVANDANPSGSTLAAATGALAGKNVVENNALSDIAQA